MSRQSGHDGRAVKALEDRENTNFSLIRAGMDLEIAEMKVKQAIRRPSEELLRSAVELIHEARERISRASA